MKSVASGSITAPRVQVRSSLKPWSWTGPQARVWSVPRSRWTVRASGSTASPSRPMTAGRDLMEWTARNPTSWSSLIFHVINITPPPPPLLPEPPRLCTVKIMQTFLLPVVNIINLSLLVSCRLPPSFPQGHRACSCERRQWVLPRVCWASLRGFCPRRPSVWPNCARGGSGCWLLPTVQPDLLLWHHHSQCALCYWQRRWEMFYLVAVNQRVLDVQTY